jgi:predicted enzyme related to lactoylglutathione lyase
MAGVIGWHELYTSDLGVASFYAELLGAEIETADMGELQYPMLKQGGKTHGGFVLKDSDHQQVPSHWYPYVMVDDVDASVEQAKSLGSQLLHGPADVGDTGIRFAVLMDPQHATYGVISSPNPPAEGLFVWDELHATDTAAGKQHYTELLGWTAAQAMENYEIFSAGDRQVAGLYAKDDDSPGAYWLTYLGVDDVDASTAKAEELGAGVMIPPADIEGIGRFSVITDPTGAAVGLFKPNG